MNSKTWKALIGWVILVLSAIVMCYYSAQWHLALRVVILVAWTVIVSNYAFRCGIEKASETMVNRENVIVMLNHTAKKVMAQTAANIFTELERREHPEEQHLAREEFREAIIQKASDRILEQLKENGDFFS